jgi:hypothetical protein
MRILLLFVATLVFARVNPFVPVVTNESNHTVKKEYFSQKKIQLPNDARVLKSISFTYQSLTGAIRTINYPINKAIDWHNPIYINTKTIKSPTKTIKIAFLNMYIKKQKLFIQTKDKLIRQFFLVKPFRFVCDFKANKNFLTYTKKTKTFIKKIVLGNHSGFYRVVLYLDGTYSTNITNTKEGYLIEFK